MSLWKLPKPEISFLNPESHWARDTWASRPRLAQSRSLSPNCPTSRSSLPATNSSPLTKLPCPTNFDNPAESPSRTPSHNGTPHSSPRTHHPAPGTTFTRYLAPLLQKLTGAPLPRRIRLPLSKPIESHPFLAMMLPALLNENGKLEILSPQNSGHFLTPLSGTGFVEIPPNSGENNDTEYWGLH